MPASYYSVMIPGAAHSGRLLLASRSARRRQLLSEAGIDHDWLHPGIEDSHLFPGQAHPAQWVAALAHLKAQAGLALALESGRTPTLVLGADTVCVKSGELLGTPVDVADAERILRTLMNGEHDVVTGVAILNHAGSRRLFVDSARVRVGNVPESELRSYLESGQWGGKAGAYNLSERLAAGWPIEYAGDPTTIMGLPMRKLLGHLGRIASTGVVGVPGAGVIP